MTFRDLVLIKSKEGGAQEGGKYCGVYKADVTLEHPVQTGGTTLAPRPRVFLAKSESTPGSNASEVAVSLIASTLHARVIAKRNQQRKDGGIPHDTGERFAVVQPISQKLLASVSRIDDQKESAKVYIASFYASDKAVDLWKFIYTQYIQSDLFKEIRRKNHHEHLTIPEERPKFLGTGEPKVVFDSVMSVLFEANPMLKQEFADIRIMSFINGNLDNHFGNIVISGIAEDTILHTSEGFANLHLHAIDAAGAFDERYTAFNVVVPPINPVKSLKARPTNHNDEYSREFRITPEAAQACEDYIEALEEEKNHSFDNVTSGDRHEAKVDKLAEHSVGEDEAKVPDAKVAETKITEAKRAEEKSSEDEVQRQRKTALNKSLCGTVAVRIVDDLVPPAPKYSNQDSAKVDLQEAKDFLARLEKANNPNASNAYQTYLVSIDIRHQFIKSKIQANLRAYWDIRVEKLIQEAFEIRLSLCFVRNNKERPELGFKVDIEKLAEFFRLQFKKGLLPSQIDGMIKGSAFKGIGQEDFAEELTDIAKEVFKVVQNLCYSTQKDGKKLVIKEDKKENQKEKQLQVNLDHLSKIKLNNLSYSELPSPFITALHAQRVEESKVSKIEQLLDRTGAEGPDITAIKNLQRLSRWRTSDNSSLKMRLRNAIFDVYKLRKTSSQTARVRKIVGWPASGWPAWSRSNKTSIQKAKKEGKHYRHKQFGRIAIPVARYLVKFIFWVIKLPYSALKLTLEFVPEAAAQFFGWVRDYSWKYLNDKNKPIDSIGAGVNHTLIAVIGLIGLVLHPLFKITRQIGMRVTSPIRSAKEAYAIGAKFGDWLGKKTHPHFGAFVGNFLVGGILTTASVAISVVGIATIALLAAPVVLGAVGLAGMVSSIASIASVLPGVAAFLLVKSAAAIATVSSTTSYFLGVTGIALLTNFAYRTGRSICRGIKDFFKGKPSNKVAPQLTIDTSSRPVACATKSPKRGGDTALISAKLSSRGGYDGSLGTDIPPTSSSASDSLRAPLSRTTGEAIASKSSSIVHIPDGTSTVSTTGNSDSIAHIPGGASTVSTTGNSDSIAHVPSGASTVSTTGNSDSIAHVPGGASTVSTTGNSDSIAHIPGGASTVSTTGNSDSIAHVPGGASTVSTTGNSDSIAHIPGGTSTAIATGNSDESTARSLGKTTESLTPLR